MSEQKVTDLLRGGIEYVVDGNGNFLALELGTLDIGVLRGDESLGASLAGPNECYRYDLYRRWGPGPMLAWLMLNPSTADALKDDHTIRRCRYYARREGYDGIVVRNLFAYRTSKPTVLHNALKAGVDVIGPDNDWWLDQLLADDDGQHPTVVAAWGGAGRWAWPRIDAVERRIRNAGVVPLALGVTEHGQPRHPSRLSNEAQLSAYPP